MRDAAVLKAVGLTAEGKYMVLGVSVLLSEHEVHWRSFLQSLVQRGLSVVQLSISDDHQGLGKARRAVFGAAPWQHCQFHLQQNAQGYVPRKTSQSDVAGQKPSHSYPQLPSLSGTGIGSAFSHPFWRRCCSRFFRLGYNALKEGMSASYPTPLKKLNMAICSSVGGAPL